MGCVIRTRVIGAVEAEESEDGKKWVRNDRLIGVATHAHLHENVGNLKTLNPNVLDEIEAFFEQYNRMEGSNSGRRIGSVPSRPGNLSRAVRRGSGRNSARRANFPVGRAVRRSTRTKYFEFARSGRS